jgi:hypothetical protein
MLIKIKQHKVIKIIRKEGREKERKGGREGGRKVKL